MEVTRLHRTHSLASLELEPSKLGASCATTRLRFKPVQDLMCFEKLSYICQLSPRVTDFLLGVTESHVNPRYC